MNGHAQEVLGTILEVIKEDRQILEEIELRRARRAINPEIKISRNDLELLIKAATLAPSCFNNQPWRFVVFDDPEVLEKVKENLSGGNYWAKKAPSIIGVFVRKEDDCSLSEGRDYFLFDAGLAVGNLLLQATRMGIIAHPVAGYDPLRIKKLLKVPEDFTLITLIILGYKGKISSLSEKHRHLEISERNRKSLQEVMAFNSFPFK